MPAMFYTFPNSCSSPIQTLPVEILSYIFTLATHQVDNSEEREGRSPFINSETIKMPLILSSVNHHWRTVARQWSSLWTSICVTRALIESGAEQGSQLNTTHLSTYLALSRNEPLDILIDARDEEWDFTEPEIVDPSVLGPSNYEPPFTPAYMRIAISLLLPHLYRWRSLNILTDTWAQMYVALQEIQPVITTYGAPCLESLTLMRCNSFISHSETFEPSGMRLPAFLNMSNATTSHHNLLPRLRHLKLYGVHVDWSSLSYILSKADRRLNSLELSSHSLDVRPTVQEFCELLSQCPDLTSLVVNGSGPHISDNADGTSIFENIQPVNLPQLRNMILGYRYVLEGIAILEILNAPHVNSLILTDDSEDTIEEPIEDDDAGYLLNYLATRDPNESVHDDHDSFMNTTANGEISLDRHDSLIRIPKSPVVDASSNTPSRAVFPELRNLTLQGVQAHEYHLHHLLNALQHLRHLELHNMSTQSVRALHPQQAYTGTTKVSRTMSCCPCPQLKSLCFRGSAQFNDLLRFAGDVARKRFHIGGSSSLQSIDLCVVNGPAIEQVVEIPVVGTTVKVRGKGPRSDEDTDCDSDSDDEDSASEVSGVFDPVCHARHNKGGISSY